MRLKVLEQELSVCKVAALPAGLCDAEPLFVARTDEELSLVCETPLAPADALAREDGWRAFRIEGELDFSLVGVLAGISGVLAGEGIGIFAVSTYNTDYILVKEGDLERALAALGRAGHEVAR